MFLAPEAVGQHWSGSRVLTSSQHLHVAASYPRPLYGPRNASASSARGPGASKTLFALRTNVAAPWDAKIREGLQHLGIRSYRDFLGEVAEQL